VFRKIKRGIGPKNVFKNFCGTYKLHNLGEIFYVFANFFTIPIRVARWHIFKPKIPIWVNFGGP
jgi:hypothetical protein